MNNGWFWSMLVAAGILCGACDVEQVSAQQPVAQSATAVQEVQTARAIPSTSHNEMPVLEQRVRLIAKDGKAFTGTAVIDGDSVVMLGGALPVTLRLSQIASLSVSRGKHANTLTGMLIGLGSGAVLGGIIGAATYRHSAP